MDFKELFNKGKDIIVRGVRTAGEKANDYKDALIAFNKLSNDSVRLGGFSENTVRNNYLTEGRQQKLSEMYLSLNNSELAQIDSFIPIDETIIEAIVIKEVLSNITFYMILTDKQVYIMNETKYKIMQYDEFKKFDTVVKDVLTVSINFNDMAFVVQSNIDHTNKVRSILLDKNVRDEEIKEKTKYLMGKIPKEQYIDKYGTGVTVTTDDKLILHNMYADNKLVEYLDIKRCELVLDTTVVMIKGEDNQSLVGIKHDARKMMVRVNFKDNSTFILETLPQSSMNTQLKEQDMTYVKYFEFSKDIMDVMTRSK